MRLALLKLGLLVCALGFMPAAIAAAQGSKRQEAGGNPGKSYVYKHSDGQPQEMEIYFPKGLDASKNKLPAILLFHGGGWSGGTLSQFRTAGEYFASRGIVAATANYQMLDKAGAAKLKPGESKKRVCVTDAKSAIRWMKQHAAELGIDPERIITGGGSAGGHIAVLATLTKGLDDPADPAGVDTSVVAYVLFNPAFAPDDVRDSEIDVLKHLRADMAPAIAFFGTKDTWLKGWQAVEAELRAKGNKSTERWIAEGRSHGFFNSQPWTNVTLEAADRFLAHHGLLSGAPTLAPPSTGEKLERAKAE